MGDPLSEIKPRTTTIAKRLPSPVDSQRLQKDAAPRWSAERWSGRRKSYLEKISGKDILTNHGNRYNNRLNSRKRLLTAKFSITGTGQQFRHMTQTNYKSIRYVNSYWKTSTKQGSGGKL